MKTELLAVLLIAGSFAASAYGQSATMPVEPPNPYASTTYPSTGDTATWPPTSTAMAAVPAPPSPGSQFSPGPITPAPTATQLPTPVVTPTPTPSEQTTLAPAYATPPLPVFDGNCEARIESMWYFKQDAYFWKEQVGGYDFVKEYGPLSTLGYQRRHGIERFRIELFGGTEAYDGGAQYADGSYEPYHDSTGTDYLGMRGEYDLFIEPESWERIHLLVGIGTRFWIRDLNDSITPSGTSVTGYSESWWTFYPYLGIETKDSQEPGPKIFASARVGCTPLTYQMASYSDAAALYPKCGITTQAEVGVRFRRFTLSGCAECMTWGASAESRGVYQPNSTMTTFGGKLGYMF